jgi:hypothetical protein
MRINMTEFQRDIWNSYPPNSHYLCQSMDRVCGCVDLTDSNVVSAPLSVNFQKFRRASVDVQHIFNGVPKLWNSINNVLPSLCLSLNTKQFMENCVVSFRNFLYKIHVSLKSNKDCRKQIFNIVMIVLSFVRVSTWNNSSVNECVFMKFVWRGFLNLRLEIWTTI